MSNTANLPTATTGFQFFVEATPYADLLPGGETHSTCWQDFCIANRFGIDAVKDTFDRIFEGFKHDIKVITELSMSLNWMSWRMHSAYEKSHRTLDGQMRDLYISLYEKVNDYVYESGEVSEDDISYYFSVTD
jgi:hypothetical protein